MGLATAAVPEHGWVCGAGASPGPATSGPDTILACLTGLHDDKSSDLAQQRGLGHDLHGGDSHGQCSPSSIAPSGLEEGGPLLLSASIPLSHTKEPLAPTPTEGLVRLWDDRAHRPEQISLAVRECNEGGRGPSLERCRPGSGQRCGGSQSPGLAALSREVLSAGKGRSESPARAGPGRHAPVLS